MRHSREMIEREYKAFGIYDIREKLRNDEKDRDRMGGCQFHYFLPLFDRPKINIVFSKRSKG